MYAELHCHSWFSLLDGVSSPEALMTRVAELAMPALALTDHDALYGAATFWRAAQETGVKPLFGVELTVGGAPHHLTLLAETDPGYAHLCQLVSAARLGSPKGQAQASWDDLARHHRGLIALSGCRQGPIAQHLLAGDEAQALRAAQKLQALFGRERFFIEVQQQLRPGDQRLIQGLLRLASRCEAPVVATNNVHYAQEAGYRLHDVLLAIRGHATLDASYLQRRGNSEAHLKGAAEMARLFADRPDALRQTVEIAQRCQVSLRRGVQDLPRFPTGIASQQEYLIALCQNAMDRRYGDEPGERAQRLLTHELAVIGQLGLTNYFLIVWDLVRFARGQGIRCQGRGSAANSLVAYLLGITPIDPLAHDLVFERFLSTERPATPDIDIDFQAERREEVIQYIYSRYGRQHAAMACTFVTYRQRSAVRDVARALDFPPDLIDALAEAADRRGLEESWRELSSSFSLQPSADAPINRRTWQLLLQLCQEIQHLPRHLGIHNGGFVLSRQPLAEIVPLEPATMPGRTVVQWDKEALEDVGMVKIDVLGLRMLGAVEEALGWVEEGEGRLVDWESGGEGDKETRRQGSGRLVDWEIGGGGRVVEWESDGGGRLVDWESGGGGRLVDWEIGGGGRLVDWESGRLVDWEISEEGGVDRLGFDDAAVYAMISAGDTVGVFQVEFAGAGAVAAAAAAKLLRRSGGGDQPDSPWPGAGRHGASLSAPPAGPGAGALPAPVAGASVARHAGGDPLPGAGAEGSAGAGRLERRTGGAAAPRAGTQGQPGGFGAAAPALRGRCNRARRVPDCGRPGFRPTGGLRQLLLRQKPRRSLRGHRLPVGLAQALPSCALLCRPAQPPAHGLLEPGRAAQRRPPAWHRRPAGRCERERRQLHA
ncbi:MAG: DNA polymerase III subunit alpha [Anaerolineae bacterium]